MKGDLARSSRLEFASIVGDQVHTHRAIIPNEYKPDEDDPPFRDPRIPKGTFHSIGRGTQAEVLAAIRQRGDLLEKVAAKRYDIHELERSLMGFTYLLREIQNTQYLVHPNIVKMLDSFYEEDPMLGLRYVWITTERMDCSLKFYFERLERIDREKGVVQPRDHRHLASLMVQLFRALDFLHQRGIMHRDINPKNIGMNKRNFEIKLLDFGVSGQTNSSSDHTRVVSTPPIYQPLEVILGQKYDCGMDVWAAGLVALGMLGCRLMMPRNRPQDTVRFRILEVFGLPPNRYVDIFGDSLQSDPLMPSTFNEELNLALGRLENDRQFLSRANLKDLLIRILCINPQLRWRPCDCLEHPYLQLMNQKLAPQNLGPNELEEKNKRDKQLLQNMLHRFSRKTDDNTEN